MVFVLMLSFSTVSAQTLDQYKASATVPSSMDELATTSSLRANLSLSDLKLVHSFCENKLQGIQTRLNFDESSTNQAFSENVPGDHININIWSSHCSDIQNEINSRPVQSAPTTVSYPQKTSPTTTQITVPTTRSTQVINPTSSDSLPSSTANQNIFIYFACAEFVLIILLIYSLFIRNRR